APASRHQWRRSSVVMRCATQTPSSSYRQPSSQCSAGAGTSSSSWFLSMVRHTAWRAAAGRFVGGTASSAWCRLASVRMMSAWRKASSWSGSVPHPLSRVLRARAPQVQRGRVKRRAWVSIRSTAQKSQAKSGSQCIEAWRLSPPALQTPPLPAASHIMEIIMSDSPLAPAPQPVVPAAQPDITKLAVGLLPRHEYRRRRADRAGGPARGQSTMTMIVPSRREGCSTLA
ncbi:MAG: hypothetical protein JWR00_3388, partial [Rubritepida sp.]|nr:hypothetical protein [Rubritepida sp.]